MTDFSPENWLNKAIGSIPYRLALAGGWIDQPFISRLDPQPPGSMVVVALEPDCYYMERCGMATGTRKVAQELWGDGLPQEDPAAMVRKLYQAENKDKHEPSGSQDMIGLIYPGINRLDYEYRVENGIFPAHIETCLNPQVAHWLGGVIYLLPVIQRPLGYNPLGCQHLNPTWVRRLGQSGTDCYAAILAQDIDWLGATFNECMICWEALLPHTVYHPTIPMDLLALLKAYQERYPGAMYSGCGGGYLVVVSPEPVPGAARVRVRLGEGQR
jgi:hypothetical protein